MRKKQLATIFLCMLCSAAVFATEASHVIPEVNAKAKQRTNKTSNSTMQTTHISRQDIHDAPPLNLTNLLAQTQSIVRMSRASGDSGQTVFSIRGFGDNAAENSLILVDGFPLTTPSLLAPNVNSIALENIERVDIFQGSQGTLWGDQAVGGVVSITTRHPNAFMAEANAGAGSFNQKYVSALLGNKLKNGVFLKAFALSDSTDNYREHNDQHLQSGLAQAGIDYARGTIGLSLRAYNNTTFFPGGLTQTQYDDNPRQATNFSNFSRYHTNIYQIINKHSLSSDWILETRLANKAINADGHIMTAFQQNQWEELINPQLTGKWRNNKIIVGYSGIFSHFHMNSPLVDNSVSEKQHNIYTQFTIPVIDTLDFTIGGRDVWQNNEIKKASNPTVNARDQAFVSEQGIAYQPNTAWRFYLRRDGNFSFAKANEQTSLYQGVTSLQPQTGVSYETGVTWVTEKQKAQLSLYQLRLHDEIAFNPQQTSANPFGAYQNFSATTRNGVTVTETYQLTTNTVFNTQINYVDARFAAGTYSGEQIPAVPAINANIGLSHDWTQQLQTKIYALYTGDRYASEDNANQGKKLPGYWVDNVALQYKISSLIASFEIENIFNQTFSAYTVYDVDTQQNTYYPGAGRAYLLTLKAGID